MFALKIMILFFSRRLEKSYLYIQRNRNGQALDHKSQIWNNNNLDYFHHIRLAETHENVCSLRKKSENSAMFSTLGI